MQQSVTQEGASAGEADVDGNGGGTNAWEADDAGGGRTGAEPVRHNSFIKCAPGATSVCVPTDVFQPGFSNYVA